MLNINSAQKEEPKAILKAIGLRRTCGETVGNCSVSVQEGSVSAPPADCSPICLTSLYHKLVIIPPRHHDMKIVSVVVCRHDEIEAGHHW